MSKHAWITLLMVLGLVGGAALGETLHRHYDGQVPTAWLEAFHFVGQTLFMGLLKMVLVPLVAASVIVGVGSVGDASQLGKAGAIMLFYYFTSMGAAAVLGLALVTAWAPGQQVDEAFRNREVAAAQDTSPAMETIDASRDIGLLGAARNIVEQLIPDNPLGAAARGEILPLISFSLMLGIALTVVGPRARPVLAFAEALLAAVMQLVEWILLLAPVGVFCLMAWTVAGIGAAALIGPLALYIATVLVGLAIHGLVVLPLVLFVFGRTNPYKFLWAMRAALLTAFGTASSSATLPLTMELAVTRGGVSKRAGEFVLPLGATMNMNGTALFEVVAVVFLFQCFGIGLEMKELAIVVITATLAAVGAAGIPSAGLVTMVIVVEAVNSSLGGDEQLPIVAIGLILGVDRILDMSRTALNVWDDAVGAKLLTPLLPDALTVPVRESA